MVTRIPWRLIGYAALALLLLFGANHALGFVPFTPQWSAKRAEAKADRLEAQVSTLEREATGNAEIGQAVERHFEREVIVREIAAQAETEARNAPDATTPLSQERADRLRLNDQRVCDNAPTLCINPDPAPGSSPAVPPAGSAG
jgi:DNA topoisomerase IA